MTIDTDRPAHGGYPDPPEEPPDKLLLVLSYEAVEHLAEGKFSDEPHVAFDQPFSEATACAACDEIREVVREALEGAS